MEQSVKTINKSEMGRYPFFKSPADPDMENSLLHQHTLPENPLDETKHSKTSAKPNTNAWAMDRAARACFRLSAGLLDSLQAAEHKTVK
jgi:hypothetical protein